MKTLTTLLAAAFLATVSLSALASVQSSTTQIRNVCSNTVQQRGIKYAQLVGGYGGSAPHCRCSHRDANGHCDHQTCS